MAWPLFTRNEAAALYTCNFVLGHLFGDERHLQRLTLRYVFRIKIRLLNWRLEKLFMYLIDCFIATCLITRVRLSGEMITIGEVALNKLTCHPKIC